MKNIQIYQKVEYFDNEGVSTNENTKQCLTTLDLYGKIYGRMEVGLFFYA